MMDEQANVKSDNSRMLADTLREWLSVGLRHWRLMALCFTGIFLGSVVAAALLPQHYESHAKILVKRERLDPLVTADQSSPLPQSPAAVTDTELNSEVELIKSRDLLERVVTACGLQKSEKRSLWRALLGRPQLGQQELLAAAVRRMESKLKVEPLPKTSLISITYDSTSAEQSARVLTTLVNFYMEKHLAVHRPPGAFEFFQQQTKQYEKELAGAQTRLADFSRQQGVVSPHQEKEATLQKLAEFEAQMKQTQASIAETERRIHTLEAQAASLPARMTTSVRTADNPQLMAQLKSTLVNLELKRTELLGKFDPSYRLVKEVETQIGQTREAIEKAEKAQLREETTDRNPAYEWTREELAKSRSELAALQARSEALTRSVNAYRGEARQLDEKEVVQQSLLRDVKADETNYLLYLRKQEEARISDALDRSRIVNVAIAEAAAVPSLPSRSRWLTLLLGFLLALVTSVGCAIVAEYMDPSLRTSGEVKEFLDVPVLASFTGRNR